MNQKMRKIGSAALMTMCLLLSAGCSAGSGAEQTQNSTGEENKEGETMLVRTLEFDGKEMEYLHFGNENGEKLVILPGLSLKSVMGSAEGIVSAYRILSEIYDIYLFDHIKEEPEGYAVTDMAEDTVRALKELGLDHVSLMGVSMGGMVSQCIALKHPEIIDALVLCSTTSDAKHADQTVFETWLNLAEQKDASALMESFGEYVYTPSFFEKYRELIVAQGEGVTDLDYRNFITSLKGIREFDVSGEIGKITCPVLVLAAGEDRVVGKEASEYIAGRLNGTLYVFEGYGHGVYDEAPDYLEHIKEFLGGISRKTN